MAARRAGYVREPHWHCCRQCRQRYEDTCATPATNGRCTQCRLGNGWQLLRGNRAPRSCCLNNSRLLDKDERHRLRHVGDGTWWLCRICHRTQGYDPAIRVYPLDHHQESV